MHVNACPRYISGEFRFLRMEERTDMEGAYRWDAVSCQWMPLLDWISLDESNLQGVESIAIDPQNP